MDETKLRKFIKEQVLEFLTKKKILAEAEKEGPSKPTSGMTKTKSSKTHTDSNKTTGPKAGKVTTEGPGKSTLANAEPTEVDNEVKVMKTTEDEPIEKGKDGKQSSDGYKTECLGVELDVKGVSHADINHLYLIGQVRKALEGRGTYVKKVTIEMGEPEKLEESKEMIEFRSKIRGLIKEELKKKDKLIIEGVNDTESFLDELDDSEKVLLLSVLKKFESEGGPVGKSVDDLKYYTLYAIDLSLKKATKHRDKLSNLGKKYFISLIEKFVNFTGKELKPEHDWRG